MYSVYSMTKTIIMKAGEMYFNLYLIYLNSNVETPSLSVFVK